MRDQGSGEESRRTVNAFVSVTVRRCVPRIKRRRPAPLRVALPPDTEIVGRGEGGRHRLITPSPRNSGRYRGASVGISVGMGVQARFPPLNAVLRSPAFG